MSNHLDCEGTFECEVTKPDWGWLQRSKDKGTPYICLPLEVIGKDVDAGKTIAWNGWLSDKAFDRTIDTLIEVFGFDGDMARFHDGGQGLEGMKCQIVTEFQEYNGKKYTKVKYLNKAGYVHEVSKLDADEAKKIITQFSGRAKKRALAAKSNTQSPATPKDEDDDIPF